MEKPSKYLTLKEAAYELQVSTGRVSRFFDEAAADGVELLQDRNFKRIDRSAFWDWLKNNKDVSASRDAL